MASIGSLARAADLQPEARLSRHPFLYTGEWDHRRATQTLFVVRDGKVAWTSIQLLDEHQR